MKRIAVSLILAALVACHADQMLPSPPSALIRDAGHNGGNFFFAFLQPMVAQPTRNGVFDATQSPTVKVALLSGDASCTDPHLTYTMSTGPGGDASETVRVNATDGNYIVNLHTDKVAVTNGCTYRIRVFIGLIELGFADIQLFLTQGAAKNLTDNETVGLVDGRTLPIKFWIAQGVLRDVGQGTASPDHETVIVTQNLKAGVLIPAGAVSAPTTILIESVDDRPCFPGLVGQTFQGLPGATDNSCYRFRTDPPLPDGKFNTNVTVGLCVDLSQVTTAQKPKIQIFQFDAAGLRLPDRIKALPDAPAPFLPCDPAYPGGIGLGKRGILDYAAHLFTSLFSPKPAFARSRAVVFDLGAGGSTDGFSLFTWGLVTDMAKNAGDLQAAAVGTAVATPPSVIFKDSTGALVDSVPVTFTAGSGSGAVTGAFTKSGRGGVSGVARVGSWTLGSTGTNTLEASAPAFSGVTPTSVTFTATAVPQPILAYRHSEQYVVDAVNWDRYRLTVTNRSSFPAMFAPAPDLPPCGSNTNSSQSWVDIYDGTTNARIYGFCALTSPEELNDIWFAVPRWTQPPASVYITITDRRSSVVYTSNTISLFGPLFVNFPRQVELDWSAVPGAVSYEIEMQYCESWGSPDWRNCNSAWQPWTHLLSYTGGVSYVDTFVGDQPGRWRIRANDAAGNPIGSFTEYKYFTYITGPGAP